MNNQKKLALCFAAISPIAAVASPLAYPKPHMWHFTAGANTGVEHYDGGFEINTTGVTKVIEYFNGSSYALGFDQSVGYGRWFYLQAKESGSTSITSSSYDDDAGGQDRRTRPSFFDADIRAYFPFALSKKHMVTLQPQIGFAMHYLHLRSRGNTAASVNDHYTRYRSRALTPVYGLALGCDVSACFNFRFGLAFETVNFKHRVVTEPSGGVDSGWRRLRMRRAAIHSTLDLSYKVGKVLDLTGSIDHLNYCPVGQTRNVIDPADVDTSFINRFTYKAGVRWKF